MKKIKITKEQYNKIAKYLTESVKIPTVPDMGKRVVNSFAQVGVKIKESSEIESDSKEKTLEKQTIDFINYLYNKDENLPSYDEICEKLVSKGIVINVDGKFRLSKSLGSAEQAKQALENELRNMLGGEKEEIEEINIGGQFKTKFLNAEIAIMEKDGEFYVYYYDNDKEEIKDNIDAPIIGGEKHGEYAGKIDGKAKYDDDIDYEYGEKEITSQGIDNYVNRNLGEFTFGIGMEGWMDGLGIILIDDELKNELISIYDKNPNLINFFTDEESKEANKEQPLNELHGEDEATFIQRKMKDHDGLSYDMAKALYKTQNDSHKYEKKFFKQRDLQNAINSKKAEDAAEKAAEIERLKSKIVSKPEPISKNPNYTQTRLPFDEMALGGAGAMGGVAAPNTAANSGPYGAPLGYSKRKLEETTQGEGSIGTYDANALSIGRNGEFNKGEQPRAFKEPQWAGGTFPQQPECSKPNNNKEAQNGGCNSGASSLKLKKVKGSVNAPSLGENKIYETIAKKTGKTIDEVKRIIELKKNKG